MSKGFAYALTRLLCPLAAGTLRDMLAIVAHDNVTAIKGVLSGMADTTKTDLLRDGDRGGTGTLAGGGGLQNASVSTRNSVHKTHGGRHDDGGGGDVDAVKNWEERARETK